MRHYWNSITIRIRRNWATGSQLWGPLLILERSSLSPIPWIKMVMHCCILHFELPIISACSVSHVLCTHSLNSAWFCSEKLLCKSGTFYVRVVLLMHSVTHLFKSEIRVSVTIQGCAELFRGTSSGVGSRLAALVCHSVLGNWHGTSLVQHSSSTLVVLSALCVILQTELHHLCTVLLWTVDLLH